jgi:ABC-2 type transport system ATP-binding protein
MMEANIYLLEKEGFMIEVAGLTKTFGQLTALDDVSFKVEKGQIVGFLGANGAGKTTTMDILCGCIGADRGKATIAGFDITDQPIKAKTRLGYLPDEPPLYKDMRVREYVSYAAQIRRVPSAQIGKRVNDAIEKLSLGDVQKRLVGNLSKGFRQRVGLAQAIVHNPDVLILDEPTEGLDPNQIIQIRDLIKSLAGEHTILLSSHILSEVQNTCDRIIIIHKGKILRDGSCAEITRSAQSSCEYLIEVQKDSKRFIETLDRMSFVDAARLDPTSSQLIRISVATELQNVDELAKAAWEGGHGLKHISVQKQTLEDVFVQLTH